MQYFQYCHFQGKGFLSWRISILLFVGKSMHTLLPVWWFVVFGIVGIFFNALQYHDVKAYQQREVLLIMSILLAIEVKYPNVTFCPVGTRIWCNCQFWIWLVCTLIWKMTAPPFSICLRLGILLQIPLGGSTTFHLCLLMFFLLCLDLHLQHPAFWV